MSLENGFLKICFAVFIIIVSLLLKFSTTLSYHMQTALVQGCLHVILNKNYLFSLTTLTI